MEKKISTQTSVLIAGGLIAAAVFFRAPVQDKTWQAPAVQPATTTQPTLNVVGVVSDDHIIGKADAPVVLIEYSDLECPFCKKFHDTLHNVVKSYDGKVAWVYRHYPIDQLHSQSRKEAEATECAAELGGEDMFWKFTDEIFKITPSNNKLDLDQLSKTAEKFDLDVVAFNKCVSEGKYANKVEAMVRSALEAGAKGTPYTLIVTKDGIFPVTGGAVSESQLKYQIDALLK